MCFNFGGAPSQSDTGGQSPRKLNRSVYRVSPFLSQPRAVQRIAGAIIPVSRWCHWLGYYGVLSGIGMKQCIRSESAGVRLLSLKVALQFSSASVFAIEEEISYFCLSIFPCSNFIGLPGFAWAASWLIPTVLESLLIPDAEPTQLLGMFQYLRKFLVG